VVDPPYAVVGPYTKKYCVEAPLGFTAPFRTALVFLRLLAAPVLTVGDEAAPATPTAIPNAASAASSRVSVRFIDTSSKVCCPLIPGR
jgi:hypothetical protein